MESEQQQDTHSTATAKSSDVDEGSSLDTGRNTNNINSNSIFAQSVVEQVLHSWELIAMQQQAVGIDFFTRVLMDNPDLLQLFSFGPDLRKSLLVTKDDNNGSDTNKEKQQQEQRIRNCPALQHHARVVMDFIGRGVHALHDLEALIHELRTLGQTHVRAGVATALYEMFYRHLMASFRAALGEDQWNADIEQAWKHIYQGMATVMDAPDQMDETEPLTGWGLVLAAAYTYIAYVSPFRLAGLSNISQLDSWAIRLVDVLDALAALVLIVDALSSRIVRAVQLGNLAHAKRYQSRVTKWVSPIRCRVILVVHSLHLERWMPWPRLDAVILLSYVAQNLHRWPRVLSQGLYDTHVGVSWWHALGLVRVWAILRVFFMARCAENARMLQTNTTTEWRRRVSVGHLLVTILFVTHVAACVWLIVARVELGPAAHQATGSDFMPDASLIMGQGGGVLRSYLLAFYWAWTNLAGTGNVESTPLQPLEILATLLVHVCGATLFAIATGHVVSMLEQWTEEEGKVGNDLAELRAFMQDCEMTSVDQERIMHGYVTQNLMHHSQDDDVSIPDLKEDVGRKLPLHFRKDLELHACAVALQRRNPYLAKCSPSFLFGLANGMRNKRRLLPGDYLFRQGEKIPRRFYVVDRGTLEIVVGDESVKTLQRGDAIGLAWLLDATRPETDRPCVPSPCGEWSDWLQADGSSGVDLRATAECIVALGLPSPLEMEALQRRFPQDFAILRHQRDMALETLGRRRIFRAAVGATIAFAKKTS